MPCFPLTQLHLQQGAAQHSPLLLATEQRHKGKWGLSAYNKGSSMAVVEGGKKTFLIHFLWLDFPRWFEILSINLLVRNLPVWPDPH